MTHSTRRLMLAAFVALLLTAAVPLTAQDSADPQPVAYATGQFDLDRPSTDTSTDTSTDGWHFQVDGVVNVTELETGKVEEHRSLIGFIVGDDRALLSMTLFFWNGCDEFGAMAIEGDTFTLDFAGNLDGTRASAVVHAEGRILSHEFDERLRVPATVSASFERVREDGSISHRGTFTPLPPGEGAAFLGRYGTGQYRNSYTNCAPASGQPVVLSTVTPDVLQPIVPVTPNPALLNDAGVLDVAPLPDPDSYPFAAVFADDPLVGAVAVSPYGDLLGVRVARDAAGEVTHIAGATHVLPTGDTLTVELNAQGLPAVAIINETIVVFGGYSGDTVDIAVLFPDGTSVDFQDVPLNPELVARAQELNALGRAITLDSLYASSQPRVYLQQPSVDAVNSRSLTYLANVTALGVTLVGCTVTFAPSAGTGVGLAVWAAACLTGTAGAGAAVSESSLRLWNSVHDAGRNRDEDNFNAGAAAVNIAGNFAADAITQDPSPWGWLGTVIGSVGEIFRRDAVRLEQKQIEINAANDRLFQQLEQARATHEADASPQTVGVTFGGIPIALRLDDPACPDDITVPGTLSLTVGASGLSAAINGSGSGSAGSYCGEAVQFTWDIAYTATLTGALPPSEDIATTVELALAGSGSMTLDIQISDCGFGQPCGQNTTAPMTLTMHGNLDLSSGSGSGTVSGNVENQMNLAATWQTP